MSAQQSVRLLAQCRFTGTHGSWWVWTWVQLPDSSWNQQAALLLLGLRNFYLWLCEAGYLRVCVYVFGYSLINVRWDVVRQQWLRGTAEWSDFPSMALSLLGNRLAARLHTSPLRWPRTQGQRWGMGTGARCRRGALSAKVQGGFISKPLNWLWLCHFYPRHLSGHNLGSVPRLRTLRFCQGCCLLDASNKYAWIRWAAGTYPELKSDQSEIKENYRCVWNMWGPKAGSTKARPCKFILRLRQCLRI